MNYSMKVDYALALLDSDRTTVGEGIRTFPNRARIPDIIEDIEKLVILMVAECPYNFVLGTRVFVPFLPSYTLISGSRWTRGSLW